MMDERPDPKSPRVIVVADVDSNAQAIVERILKPSGFHAWVRGEQAPEPDVLVVDITQLRGNPLASLRNYRSTGSEAPAILLAAHFPLSRLRELFQLGVGDFLLKPYRPSELCQAIADLAEARSSRSERDELAGRFEHLRAQLRRRTDEIRMLSQIGRVVASLDDLSAILRSVCEAAAFMTDAEESAIYLADPHSRELVLRASKQAGERHATLQRLRVNDTLVGEVYHTGQPVLRQPSPQTGPVKVQTGFLVQSTVNVPLRVGKKVVGVLGVYNRLAPRTFNEHHTTLLMALSDWAGVALEKAALKRAPEPPPSRPAPEPEQPISAASPDLAMGVQEVVDQLRRLLRGPEAGEDDRQSALEDILHRLESLQEAPVIRLDPQQTRELVDLHGLIKKVVEKMQPEARKRGLELIAERGNPIPLFKGERERVRQVLEALIAAAIRRTKRGRVVLEAHTFEIEKSRSREFPLTVQVDMPDGNWAAVRVSDSSAGLSPDTIRAITAPETNPLEGKMGPGLSMGEIRLIVESMGGVMWYEHTPASTSITFALPTH